PDVHVSGDVDVRTVTLVVVEDDSRDLVVALHGESLGVPHRIGFVGATFVADADRDRTLEPSERRGVVTRHGFHDREVLPDVRPAFEVDLSLELARHPESPPFARTNLCLYTLA